MSLPKETTVTCDQCHKAHPFTDWESLNVTLDAECKQQLLKGQLTQFTGPACGWSGEVLYPMLYHDMEKRLMIWLWPAEGDPEAAAMPSPTSILDNCLPQ